MGDTPRLNFPYIVSSNILDALVQPVIEEALVNNPPANPAAGVLYVVGRSPNGAWTGKAECLAQFVNDVWTFYVPFEGLTAWNKASKSRWYYSGTEWSELSDDQHSKRTDNPHQVTAVQLGAETPSGAQTKANAVQTNLTSHINNGTHKWSSITDKPSMLKDYGIGDAYTKAEADSFREEAKTQIGAEQSELGVEIKGRTLVNLLGKDGNFEVDSNGDGVADGWVLGNVGHWSTVALDSTEVYTGTKSQKLVGSGGGSFTSIIKNCAISANKYYVLLANVKSLTATAFYTRFGSDSGGLTFTTHTISSSWSTIVRKLNPTIDATMVQFYTSQATPNTNTFYLDGARMYEVTQAEYNAIDSMTADQVAAKYPYIDSVQFKKDILVTQIGRNLIPAFNSGEWDTSSATMSVLSATSINLVSATARPGPLIPVKPNTTYISSCLINNTAVTAGMTRLRIDRYDVNKVLISNGTGNYLAFGVSGNSGETIITPANCYYINPVLQTSGDFVGTSNFSNLQLELGSVTTNFEPQVKSYTHTPMQIAQDESIWLTPTTSVYKEVWKKNVVGDGSLDWRYNNAGTGYKGAYVTLASYPGHPYCTVVKYTGVPLLNITNNAIVDSAYTGSSGAMVVVINNVDSGWVDSFAPTNAEIKAYFYGWKMCASDGGTFVSGQHYWKKITDGSGITSTLPTASYSGYTPYVLHYKLATPIYHINYYNSDPTKPIMSAGSVVNIPQGVTQVEQRSGVSFKEKANPALYSANFHINSTGIPTTQLSYRTKKIFRVDGGKLWSISNTSNTYGLERAFIDTASYDSTVIYTVTYEQLDKYLYTVDTFAIDNPVPTRQRNFALDSTEQKIAYFKVNPVSLVGATANQNPKTLADYGVLDAYTKDDVDAAVKTKLNFADSLANGTVYKYRDVTAYHLSGTATGTAKIILPVSWLASTIVLAIEGWSSAGTNVSHWDVTVSGFTQGSGNWILTAATLHPNCPFSSVRFGFDSVAGKCCILLGTTTTAWDNIKIVVKEAFIGNSNVAAYGTGWSMSIIADETTLTKIVAPTTKTIATLEKPIFSGNVGIGKTPTVALDVAGTICSDASVRVTRSVSDNSALVRVQNDTGRRLDLYSLGSTYSPYHSLKPNTSSVYTNTELGVEVDGAYPITFWTNGSERMRIGAGGNSGVGTTNPVNDAKLTLREDANQVFALAMQNRQNNITWYQYVDVGAVGDSSFGILNTATGSNVFCINPAGKIGISGITDPKANLHSTGSTILGVERSTLNYSNIGNSQMQMSLSESDNVLWLDAKRSDGTIKQIGLPLGTSTIITGTSLWISSEIIPVVNTVTSVAHGLTLDPVRCKCDVLLKCVVAQGNYSVGDFAMGVIVNVGGSAEFVLSPALDSTNIRVNSGSGGPYAMNKTTGAYFQVTPANWRYVFRIWY